MTPEENISPQLIKDEMESCYLDYAMSVIVGRALPDVRDGLKPVHRRVLYAMANQGNFHNRPFLKSARIVGDVIGKYHPHGDAAVYSTIVRMAQDFSLRYPLVDGQGNFGSIDGDSAAAMRYTEIRMRKMAEELLSDLDKETVDWRPNYDDSLKEPMVLPAKIPHLLINGSAGIAVGMATNIPSHNLGEVVKGLVHLLKNPDSSISELMKLIPGPDFPTYGTIHGKEGIRSAYKTGKGIIQIRGEATIEPYGKSGGRERIVITELPYQVNKARFIEKIADLANSKVLNSISDVRDESNREGIRIAVDLKKGDLGHVVLNQLYKHTQLQVGFGVIFLALKNGHSPKVMNLKEMLEAFLEHRREVVIRRAVFDLKKARDRAHILEGLKAAIENIDQVVERIKTSQGPKEAKERLVGQFSLTEIQAQAILDLRLQRLTGLERDKIIKEYNETLATIKKLEKILGSEALINEVMEKEFLEVLENYKDKRRTKIIGKTGEVSVEDLIKSEDVIVTVTHKGYIKRMAMNTYKTQKRGGIGVKGGQSTEEDIYTDLFIANTHSDLLFFTTRGTMFIKKVYSIPESERMSKGRNLANFIQLPPGEKIRAIRCLPHNESVEGKFLLFATEKGLVKKSPLESYLKVRSSSGLKAIKVQDGDGLLDVKITDGSRDIFLCSSGGKIIRFSESDARPLGRVSQGVKGMALDEEEKIVGMAIIDNSSEILSVTENGLGKRTSVSEYRRQARGGKGIKGMRLSEKTGPICAIMPVTETDELIIITNAGQVLRTKVKEASIHGRVTQGVRLIRLKEGEKVVALEKIIEHGPPS